ncbi:MAG TPA: hypothetical protein VM639_05780 [Dongiaceae bacterium]|nr:hypothetical protein [Dongiaceae bacterium]
MTIKAAASACLMSMLLSACAQQPQTLHTPPKTAERRYDCVDVNGPIGTLILTAGGEALIMEPDAAADQPPNLFGRYEEQTDAIIIHSQDLGSITYRIEGEKLISEAPEMSSVLVDRVTCTAKR